MTENILMRFQSETSVFKFLQRMLPALKTEEAAIYINCERPTANQQTFLCLFSACLCVFCFDSTCLLFVHLHPILNKTCVYSTCIFKFTVVLNEKRCPFFGKILRNAYKHFSTILSYEALEPTGS